MLWLCEPNHGAALRAALQRWQREIHKNHPLILCQRVFTLPWGRYYLDIILLLLRSFFSQRWWGRVFLKNFLQATKKTQPYLRHLLIPPLGGNQFFCHHAVFIHDVKDGGSGDSEVTMVGVSVLRYRLLVLQRQIDSHFCDTVLLPIA